MNHLKQIAAKLAEYHIDAMLVNSEPGEFYAVGLHGEGFAVVAPDAARYITDSRYIEAARESVDDAEVVMVDHAELYRSHQRVPGRPGRQKAGHRGRLHVPVPV